MRWQERMEEAARFATMVTAQGAAREPFHRWMHFKQGFSPGLVRAFLAENEMNAGNAKARLVLDPFCGSGTTVIECGRQKIRAIGVENLPSLAFLTNAAFEREFPPIPSMESEIAWKEVAGHIEHPLHRAALMLAVARQYTTAGKLNKGTKSLGAIFDEVSVMMREDLRSPIAVQNECHCGDARDLGLIEDESVAGILTSPPYLSRHDYRRIASHLEEVFSFWRHDNESPSPHSIAAHPRAQAREDQVASHVAVNEIAQALERIGEAKWAGIVRAYFQDMGAVLRECARVLSAEGAMWLVIGGARIADVYVPSDLILGEMAKGCGLRVETIRVARDLVGSRRRFGRAGHVAPRESILILRKS